MKIIAEALSMLTASKLWEEFQAGNERWVWWPENLSTHKAMCKTIINHSMRETEEIIYIQPLRSLIDSRAIVPSVPIIDIVIASRRKIRDAIFPWEFPLFASIYILPPDSFSPMEWERGGDPWEDDKQSSPHGSWDDQA